MDAERERALTLAHEAEVKHGSSPDMVVDRARLYLDFLRGTQDAEILADVRVLAAKVR